MSGFGDLVGVEVGVDTSHAVAGLSLTETRATTGLVKYLQKMGLYAQRAMMLYTVGRLQAKIAGPIRVRRLSPNEWEIVTGPKGFARWPLYVHGGTGLYNELDPRMITARHDRAEATVISTTRPRRMGRSGVLRFQGRDGRIYFRREVRGQQANPFARRAHQKTSIYAGAEAHRLGREIVTA